MYYAHSSLKTPLKTLSCVRTTLIKSPHGLFLLIHLHGTLFGQATQPTWRAAVGGSRLSTNLLREPRDNEAGIAVGRSETRPTGGGGGVDFLIGLGLRGYSILLNI